MYETFKKTFSFDKLASYLLLISIFLLPIFFIPLNIFSLEQAKMSLVSFLVMFSFVFWLIERIKTSTFSISISPLSYSLFLLPVVYAVSAWFSINRRISLIGFGFEIDTLHSIATLTLLAFLVSKLLRNKKEIFIALAALMVSLFLVIIYQLIRLFFGADFLSLGVLSSSSSTLIGNWSDFIVILGLFIAIILLALETLALNKILKIVFYVSLIISFIFIALGTFGFNLSSVSTLVYLIIGVYSLVAFTYTFSLHKLKKAVIGERVKNFIPSLVVFFISVLMIIFGGYINNKLSSFFNINYIDGRPSWQATLVVASHVVPQKPILGSGPGTFGTLWNLNKPLDFNITPFWNTEFKFGVGIIPTSLITVGILGLLAWLFLLATTLYFCYKIVFIPTKDNLYFFLKTSSVFGVLYFFIISIFYAPGPVPVSLLFIFIGFVFGIAFKEGIIKEKKIPLSKFHKLNFVFTLTSVLVVIFVVWWGYTLVIKKIAVVYANTALNLASQTGNIPDIRNLLVKAVITDEQPIYYQLLAQADVAEIAQIASLSKEDIALRKDEIQAYVNEVGNASLKAEALDKGSFGSTIASGVAFEALGGLGISGAYENAEQKYLISLNSNPNSPLPYFLLARIESIKNNNTKARDYLSKALSLKNNYVEVYILAAQLALKEGDKVAAETIATNALSFDRGNFSLSYEIGALKFDSKEYANAIPFFQYALSLNPSFANARYFLGLSLYFSGNNEEGLSQLKIVQSANPDNSALKSVIQNIENGRSPFYQVVSSGSEKASTSENNSTSTKPKNN